MYMFYQENVIMGGRKHGSSRRSADLIRKRNSNRAVLSRPDPFGVNDYFVEYSLNKKNRWTISNEISANIDRIQDDYFNIRVSASVHSTRRLRASDKLQNEPQNSLPCLEYHTASREGETVVHKQSKRGKTRLRNFTHDAQPPMRTNGKVSRPVYKEKSDRCDRLLPIDENEKHQKFHVHYTTIQQYAESFQHTRTKSTRKPAISKSRKLGNLIDTSDVEDVDDYEDFDIIVEESFPMPTIADDLSCLIVRNEKRKRTGKRKPPSRFVDEALKPVFVPTIIVTKNSINNRDKANIEDVIPHASLPTEMFTRIPLFEAPNISSINQLPCFPPAWEIHQKNSDNLLGIGLPHCVIARQFGDELRLSIVDDCPSSHPSRLQFPLTEESPPQIELVESGFCEICYGEMDLANEDRISHPFSLSCSHPFCTGCWLSHISQAIHQQRLPAACLHPTCSNTVSFAAAKGLLSSSSLETYEMATINKLKGDGKLITCPECARLHHTNGFLIISCPCGVRLCTHCSSISHFPVDCERFRQYNRYMKDNGFNSIYAATSDTPIVRNLSKCPTCKEFIQRIAGCNFLRCHCGTAFCYNCGNVWDQSHYHCKLEDITATMLVFDVDAANRASLLITSQLHKAINARIALIERCTIVRKRLRGLPFNEKKVYERTFIQLSLLVELCSLGYVKERRARERLVKRMRAILTDFMITDQSHDITKKGRALKQFHDTLVL